MMSSFQTVHVGMCLHSRKAPGGYWGKRQSWQSIRYFLVIKSTHLFRTRIYAMRSSGPHFKLYDCGAVRIRLKNYGIRNRDEGTDLTPSNLLNALLLALIVGGRVAKL